MPQELPAWFDFYNNKVVLAFFGIEKNGLKINKYELDKHYELNNENYSIQDDRVFTNYNLATTTRRPSNSFNGINFAALNKENGARRSFISSHGFMEFDISAYHPHLAARLVAMDFDGQDVHQTLPTYTESRIKRPKSSRLNNFMVEYLKSMSTLNFSTSKQIY
jgi:hypothetical protein